MPVEPATLAAVTDGTIHALLSPVVAFAVGDRLALHASAQTPALLATGHRPAPAATTSAPPVHRRITAIERQHPALLPGWCLVHLSA
jgi:hypothetical protein